MSRTTLRLSDVASVLSYPQPGPGWLNGWPRVEAACAQMGLVFDEWQRGAGMLMLAKRPDGRLANAVGGVGMSFPRQVGKTFLLTGLLFGLAATRPDTKLIWTAQHLKTSDDTFLSMQGFCRKPEVSPYIQQVFTGNGRQEVWFNNGSRILFGAREHGFGRGIPGVDGIVFDEAQHLSERALAAMIPTMNTSQLKLHLYIGTPPRPENNAEAFTRMRKKALEGGSEVATWVECSAERGADPSDRKQRKAANPSYPHRTDDAAFEMMREILSEEDYLREAFGIWDEYSDDLALAIPPSLQDVGRVEVRDVDPDWPLAAIGLDMDPDGRTYVAMAVHGPDHLVHVELLGHDILDGGSSPAVEWIRKRARRRLPVVMPGDSAVTMLEAPLRGAGVKVFRTSVGEDAQAATGLLQAFRDGEVSYLAADEALTVDVQSAQRDEIPRKPGLWRIRRAGVSGGAPLRALAMARLGAVKWSRRRAGAVSGSSSGAVFV